jgi:hypothetical protein
MLDAAHHLLTLSPTHCHITWTRDAVRVKALQQRVERHLQLEQVQGRVTILIEVGEHHLRQLPATRHGVAASHSPLRTAALPSTCGHAALLQLLDALPLGACGIHDK